MIQFRGFGVLMDGDAVLNLLPSRFLRSRRPGSPGPIPPGEISHADCSVRLTGMQAKTHDALLAALLGTSPSVVLTGAAGVGKTTVLAAALSHLPASERRVLRLDNQEGGVEEAFQVLFGSDRHRLRPRQTSKRRLVLVMDQVEAKSLESFTCLELFSRMPGKAASVQWVFVGRSEPWTCLDGPATAWLREAGPACLTLPALSEHDAWELFHRRVSPSCGLRPAAKLVAALLTRSEGSPGRFDAAVKAAVAADLLQGIAVQAA